MHFKDSDTISSRLYTIKALIEILGVLPSGVLIASGLTRFQYEPPAPAFENFAKLRQQFIFYVSVIRQCGNGQWYHVAYLNMSLSDPSQQCPSA